VLVAEMFERLVRVLDHDDGRIHHRADGDGDAAQRHDVARQGAAKHRHERQNDRDGQRDDRDQRRADVPEENQADERHDDALLDQLFAQRVDGALIKLAAVVSRTIRTPGGSEGLISSIFFLMPSMTLSAFSP
jgi:hypothetical protein